jgi:hypothetical protein
LAGLFRIEAWDRLLAGRCNMLVKLLSIFTLADVRGPEIDQGSRLRWLAEAVWFPYAFVSDAVRWEPIDSRSAWATLVADGPPVSAVFETDAEGRFVRVSAERGRDVGGDRLVLTPWVATCSDYRDFNGVRIPAYVVVIWLLDDRKLPYARFRVTSFEYNVEGR